MVAPSGMNRAFVIGSRSNVRASKVATPARAGDIWRVAATPMATPATAAAARASQRQDHTGAGTAMAARPSS